MSLLLLSLLEDWDGLRLGILGTPILLLQDPVRKDVVFVLSLLVSVIASFVVALLVWSADVTAAETVVVVVNVDRDGNLRTLVLELVGVTPPFVDLSEELLLDTVLFGARGAPFLSVTLLALLL